MPTRMYLVELKKKKVLVEATSQEAAIRTATAPLVKSCTIPTPLEVARLMRDNIEIIAQSVPAVAPKAGGEDGGGVGSMGIKPAQDGDDSGGDPGEQGPQDC